MLRSMTGFGAAAGQVEGVQYAIEVRTVNNRYLKTTVKLPEALSALEAEVDKLIRAKVQRGTVTLSAQMRLPGERAAGRINTDVMAAYLEQLKPAEVEGNPMFRVDLASILELPGVCEPPDLGDLIDATHDGFLALVDKALTHLVSMRTRDGEAVQADLLTNCGVIEDRLAAVSEIAPQVVRDYQDRLTQRVEELLSGGKAEIDADHLAREVAVFAERCDIAEEISRLTAHVEQFRQALPAEEATGRKLDFIAQEMLREANTIASKGNNSEIGRAVVEIKTAIDRIKEQVQNVE